MAGQQHTSINEKTKYDKNNSRVLIIRYVPKNKYP